MIYVFEDEKNQVESKNQDQAIPIQTKVDHSIKEKISSSITSTGSFSTSESSSHSFITSKTSTTTTTNEIVQSTITTTTTNPWKLISPKNSSKWDKVESTPKASDERQTQLYSVNPSRKIVDIIVAIEKSKVESPSQWHQEDQQNTRNQREGISSIVNTFNDTSFTSQSFANHQNIEKPYNPTQRSSLSNLESIPPLQVLPPLPPPPRPNASKQEHHRYFYALRKANRMRKQINASSTSDPATKEEMKRNAFQLSSSDSSTSSIGSHHSRSGQFSDSSNTDVKPSSMHQHHHRHQNKFSTVINPHSSQSTLFPVPSSGKDRIINDYDQFDPYSPYFITIKAWQDTTQKTRPKIAYDPQFMLDLLDSNDKDTEELFLDLDASIRLQHSELGF